MKQHRILKTFGLVLFGIGLLASPIQAETIVIEDFNFTVGNRPAGANILSGRWGVWNAGTSTFVQAVTNSLNAGFVDVPNTEMSVTLNQTSAANYAAGTAMSFAIFTNGSADAQALNFSAATRAVILSDVAWVAPSWANNAVNIPFTFSANTVARFGSYSFNGGNEVLTLAVIPEPSTFSLLIGGLGLMAFRLRRKNV